MSATSFSSDHIKALKRLKVVDTQIERLSEVLPLCAALLTDPPRKNDVKDVLERVQKACRELEEALWGVEADDAPLPEHREARARIVMAAYEREVAERSQPARSGSRAMGHYKDEVSRTQQAVAEILASANTALGGLDREDQRRTRAARWEPIRLIDQALLRGWGEKYYPVTTGDADGPRFADAPPYPFAPSSNPTSSFRRVVATCYEAFTGRRDADPERAIKAYQQFRNWQRQNQGEPELTLDWTAASQKSDLPTETDSKT